jgi:hypothetical protein
VSTETLETPENLAGASAVTGVRVHTRAPVTLSWLSRCIAPAARELVEATAGVVYLRRGWLHGPHVDIVARGPQAGTADWSRIAGWLDPGPLEPATALTDEQYLISAREFGRLEAVPPPYLPLREHGAVEFLAPSDLASRQPRLDPLREIVFSMLSKPLLATVDELAADPAMATVRLAEAFLALADTHALGAGYGVFSLRSHVEAFLAWAAPRTDVRPPFTKRLAAQAEVLRPVVRRRLDAEPSPSAAAWRTAFAYCAGALDNAVACGALTLDLLESVTAGIDRAEMGPPGAPTVVPQGEQPDSHFHRTVGESGVIDEPTRWFAAYRLLVNLFYEQLPLLTVSPMQRYYMCYAVAELVDAELGETWQQRLAREQRRVGSGGGA